MNNAYITYILRILAVQGALASVYTDPQNQEDFSAGFVEAADGQHVLMCDLTPWGQIEGWRVRRNSDIYQVFYGEEYEQRLAMLMEYRRQYHTPFFTDYPKEDTDLLLSVLLSCKEKDALVSVICGHELATGRVVEANGLRVKLMLKDFFGRDAEEETFKLCEIEVLEVDTPEEKMYLDLENLCQEQLRLLQPEES